MRPMPHWMGTEARSFRHMERLARQLELSDEQQTQVRPLLLDYAKEAIRTRADIAMTRLEIRQLLQADQPDLSNVKDMLQNSASKEAQLRFARITTLQDIRKLLTPEQQTVVVQSPPPVVVQPPLHRHLGTIATIRRATTRTSNDALGAGGQ
jgi:Spy/CpxP family protein refolding chaperone